MTTCIYSHTVLKKGDDGDKTTCIYSHTVLKKEDDGDKTLQCPEKKPPEKFLENLENSLEKFLLNIKSLASLTLPAVSWLVVLCYCTQIYPF